MNIATAIKVAGGITAISRACATRSGRISVQAIAKWRIANRLPRTEWTGETHYAVIICDLARAFGHDISPLDLCPGAGQYMDVHPRAASRSVPALTSQEKEAA